MVEEEELQFEFGVKRRLYNWHMRRQRLLLGLTQKQLAQMVGYSGITIGHIESLRYWPTETLQQRLVSILGLPIHVLFPEWLKEFRLERVPRISEEEHISLQQAQHLGLLDAPGLLTEGPEVAVFKRDLRDKVGEVLLTLSPREEKVIRLRFGLDGDGSRTIEEVAQEFKVTRERIRQIEAKALRKLRWPARSRKLKDYLD